jgi:hypothetical protein
MDLNERYTSLLYEDQVVSDDVYIGVAPKKP